MFARWLPLVAGLLLPGAAEAQSFNCAYARSPDEVLICEDPRLSALDELLSSLYYRARNSSFGYERARLEADQAAWLRSRRACGRDGACIASAYRARIQELRAY
jgi:uncharacterized protein